MSNNFETTNLFVSIKQLIEQSKQQIGKEINEVVLQNKRTGYGKQIVATLWRQLETEYGTSFSEKNLRRMMQFAEVFTDENKPIGLILCAGKNEGHVELLQLHDSNIRVADYLTSLPSKKLLQEKLHLAIEYARNRIVDLNQNSSHE